MRTFTHCKQASRNDEVWSLQNYVEENEALEKGDKENLFKRRDGFISLAEETEHGYLDTLLKKLPNLCLSEGVRKVDQRTIYKRLPLHRSTDWR